MTLLYEWLTRAADQRGNNKALVYRDNYLSWRGLLHRVDRRAQEFRAMGLRKGAWVGLMLGNVPDFVILTLALSKLDITPVPIDPTTGTRELELIMAAAPLRALVTRPRGSEATGGAGTTGVEEVRPRPPTIPVPGEEAPEIRRRLQGTLLTSSVFKKPNPEFGVRALVVLFTADSLGDPKGVLRTAENLESTAESVVTNLEFETESRVLVAVPLYHAYGWDLGLLPTLRTGATMFLEEEISARRVAKLIRDHNIDVLPGTPSMYRELAKLPTAKALKATNPRFLSGGSKLEADVAQAMHDEYGVRLISCYHTTETGVIALDVQGKNADSVGKTVDGVELRFTPPKGKKAAVGAPAAGVKHGVIWVRSSALSPCSIGPFKEENARVKAKEIGIGETDPDGWFRTGDLGRLDRSARLYLTGREDDVVKIEGKRVALGEVEGCLEAFPKVKAAQARLESDPFAGSMVVARVVATSHCEAEEIIDHCARNLAPYKVPRRIEFCDRI
ncbi:MAG TPA: class I adenylate-forming enzyme family protein [Candidatus Acidoferrum sp.]|nr:class I adenylate-forming enzyme family protein [Candidatus Acidoferrum sp.]